MDMQEARGRYFEQGYFIVDDAVAPDMIDQLEAAGRQVVDKVRSGEVDVSGQGPGSTGVLGLIDPAFGEKAFAEYYISGPLTSYVESFLGPELRMGALVLWCVEDRSYDSGWHRDTYPPRDADLEGEEEMAMLDQPFNHFKWSMAILDDPCLWVVPGSHLRNRTEEETAVLRGSRREELSGQVHVDLKRGQTVFWDGRLLHRGRKPDSLPRRLGLAASYKKWLPDQEKEETSSDWQWMLKEEVRDFLPEPARPLWERWCAVQKP